MAGWPVTINGHTYNESDMSGSDGYGYRTELPAMLNDVAARIADAEAAAIASAASAASAVNAPGTTATSVTSLTIGLGNQTLTVQAGKNFALGQTVKIAYTTTPTTWMLGTITAYNSGTGSLTVNVTSILGAGTQAAWTVSLTSPQEVSGKQSVWIPAWGMVSRITNGPGVGKVETATNKVNLPTLDFDTATAENAQFQIRMPKSWNAGTVTAVFVWSHAATTTNFGVAWSLKGLALDDSEAADGAFGTTITVTDTGGTTNNQYITAETAAVTISSSPAKSSVVVFEVTREVANAGDTMAIDARLHGVMLYYTTDAASDA